MRLRHTRRNLLFQPSVERPTHTGIEVPGVVEMIPEDVLRVGEEIRRVRNRRLHAETDVEPIPLVVDRSVRGTVSGRNVGHRDSLMTVPFLQPVCLGIKAGSLSQCALSPCSHARSFFCLL